MVFGGRQADMDWFGLEKQTKLYSIFGEDAVLGARFVPNSFPGNLLQDPGAEQWTWCDGFVGPCHIQGYTSNISIVHSSRMPCEIKLQAIHPHE